MKIEITEPVIEAIASQIGASAAKEIRKHLVELEERELIREINATIPDEKRRVLAYLRRTKRGVSIAPGGGAYVEVENRYVRERLKIPAMKLCALRRALEMDEEITVHEYSHSPLAIRHKR